MTKRATALVLCGAALALAGCGEKMAGAVKKMDTPAYQGAPAEPSAFTASGWKPGDRNSWEQELRHRTQSQNEYVRIQP